MRRILTTPRPEQEKEVVRYVIETVDEEFKPTGTVVAEAETEKEALELADAMSVYQPVAVIDTVEGRIDVGWGWVKVDERPGNYYVSVIDGPRYGLLLGPFPTHRQALAMVEAVRKKAEEIDPRAVFYAFGTCRVEGYNAPGKLNSFFEGKEE